MKNEKEDFNIQTIIQKDLDKELKLLLLPNWEDFHILINKENSEKQSIIEFSVSCFSIKIVRLLFKLNSEIKYFKNNITDENLIHICLINNEYSNGTFDNSAKIRSGNVNNSQYQYTQNCNSNIYNSNINNNYKPNETKKSNSNKTYKEGYYSKYYQKTISTFNSKRPKCETIHFLISEGIPFSKDNEGNTEIHKLLFHACKECLDYFLTLPIVKSENRKYLYEKNKHGLNPYELSIKTGNYETFNILESYYRQENHIGLIHLCAYGGNVKILKDLLNSFPQSPRKNQNYSILNTLNIDGKSAFTLSLINNHFKFANYLLDKGAKPTKSDLELVKGGINIDLFKKINNFLQTNNNNISLSMNTQRPKSQTRYSICSLSDNDNNYNKPQLNQCQNVFKFEDNMKEEEEKMILNKINSNNTSSIKSPNIYVSGKIYNKMKNYNKSLNMNNLSINNIQIDNEKYQVDALNKEIIKEKNNLHIDPIDFSDIKPNSINCFYKPSDSQKNNFLRSTQYTSAYNEVLSNLSNENNNKIEINKKTNTPTISNKNPLMLNHTKPNNLTKYLKESKRTISSHMFSITTSSNIEYMFRKSSSDGLQLIDSFSKEKDGDYYSNFYSIYNQFAFDMNLVRNISSIDNQDLIFYEKIYSLDSISEVFRGEYLGIEVAIKKFFMNKFSEYDKKHFQTELNLTLSLRHPLIVTCIGYSNHENIFYIVTEYIKNKSLKQILDNKEIKLTNINKISFCIDIAKSIWYLHSRKPQILHRDLKSSNCLVTDNFSIKLCDFGIGKVLIDNSQTNTKSTLFWMAPESILHDVFTEKSDIFSMSILFWEIWYRDTVPYKGVNETCFLFEEKLKETRPKLDDNISKEVNDLIRHCWEYDPNNRPSIKNVVLRLEEIKKIM